MKKTKQKWCLRILVWLVALLVLLGVADSCRVQEDPHRTLVQGSLQELNDSWTLETDQQAVYDIPESMGESLMLSIRSTKQKFSLGLRAADGQETVFYTYDPGSGPAEMRLFAALPEGAAGKTLVLRCAEPSALSVMLSSESVLATQTKLSSYYFRRSFYALAFFLFCAFCAAELGLLLLSMRRIFRPEVRYQICIMFGLVLDAGVWILTDSDLLTLFTDKASFVTFLSLLSFGLIVPLTLEFIRCTLKEECRNLRLLQQVQMLLLTANILGWLLRGWAMFWLLPLMHLTILASIPLTLRDLFAAYKKTRSEDVRDILVGFGTLAVCAAAALVFFYGDHAGRQYAVFYCVGLLCFLLQLGRTVIHRIRQAIDEQAQLENYKKLAYVDSLTGLFNYTAFKYMKSRWPERTDWTYIVMDVNWLKQTNDQYGHRAGDELLCCAARCIREAFYRAEDCFRIGGDEFVILCCNRKHDEVLLAVEKLRMTLRGAEYEISVGVQQGTGQENVQNIVNRAEDAMRRDKEAYYQQNGQERRMRSLNEKLDRLMQEKQDADQFIRVIAPEYIAVYLINFAQDSFRKILIPDFFRDMLDKCNGSFRRAILEYIRLYIAPEDQEEFESLTCAQVVRERLAREGTIDEHYKRSDGMPIHLRIMACDGLNKEESIWIFAKDTEKT